MVIRKELIRNRYLLLKQIGSGGFSTVFQAWDYNLEKFVAVKRIQQYLTTNASVVDTFRQEALRSAKLQHENIVHVYDFFRSVGNVCYIIMEYVRGRDLSHVIRKCREEGGEISPELSANIILGIARALSYAHKKKDEVKGEFLGIAHLDVSPANIMVYSDGRIKLTDFGIAKAVKAGAKSEDDVRKVFKGKYHYMSPEQIRGIHIDQRSDLFSLGIVLYELLTGEKPFDGPTDNEIIEEILDAEPDLSKVPEELREIARKLLDKNTAKRYKTAKEVVNDLENTSSKHYGRIRHENIAELILDLFPEIKNADETDQELTKEIISKVNIYEEMELEKTPTPITIFANSVEKTVLAQSYKGKQKNFRVFIISVIMLVFGIVPFEVFFDIPNSLTPLGRFIKTRFIPISVSVESIPEGAKVKIFDSTGKDIVSGHNVSPETPITIKGVKAGNYTLVLSMDKYGTIRKKIHIDPKAASADRKNNLVFKAAFETDITITSVPSGSEIYIEGRKTGFKTPYTFSLEAKTHSFGLQKEGFLALGSINNDRLSGEGSCTLNLSDDNHDFDKDLWKLASSFAKKGKFYELAGVLKREIIINSVPSKASVTVSDANYDSGKTPLKISLKAGKIPIRIEKSGYGTLNTYVNTLDKSKNEFSFTLKSKQTGTMAVKKQKKEEPKKLENILDPMNSSSNWYVYNDRGTNISIKIVDEGKFSAMEIDYFIGIGGQWVGVGRTKPLNLLKYRGLKFTHKGEGSANSIEIKLEDNDGSNYGKILEAKSNMENWYTVEVPFHEFEYWWGGDDSLNWADVKIHIAISRKEAGKGGAGKVMVAPLAAF